jgi:hypothetical protein
MEPQYLGIRIYFNPLGRSTQLLGGSPMLQANGRQPMAGSQWQAARGSRAERSGRGAGGTGPFLRKLTISRQNQTIGNHDPGI